MIRFFLFLILCGAIHSEHLAAEEKKARESLPYLGPGADLLSPEEYVKRYTKYIKESILAGFPPNRCAGTSCEQALAHFFQSAGLFTYPVPAGADVKIWKNADSTRECIESAGTVIQINREKGGALLEASAVLAKAPKVLPSIAKACRENSFVLEQDFATGLEKVAGIPVGYPHPFLCADSQGIVFRRLVFNNNRIDCKPIVYEDNSWLTQMKLSENNCSEIRNDIESAWKHKISSSEFARRERMRQQKNMQESILRRGGTEKQAKELVKKYYFGPIDHDLNYVGTAMRKLEYCNAMHIGDKKSSPGDSGDTKKENSTGAEKNSKSQTGK